MSELFLRRSRLPLGISVTLYGFKCICLSLISRALNTVVRYFSKEKPVKVSYGMGNDKYDKDGRIVVAEYESYQVQ